MAKKRRRRKSKPSPVVNTLVVAACMFAVGLHATGTERPAVAVMAFGLVCYAWATWKVNRVQDRWRRWRRAHREQIDAAPAVVVALAGAGAAVWWLAVQFLAWVIAAAAAAAGVAVVVAVRRRTPRGMVSTLPPPLAADVPVTYKAGGFNPRTDQLAVIKFGVSTFARKEKRMRELDRDTGNPYDVRLIAYGPGGRDREAELHRRHADRRLDGEWFEPTAEVLAEPFEHEVLDVTRLELAA